MYSSTKNASMNFYYDLEIRYRNVDRVVRRTESVFTSN